MGPEVPNIRRYSHVELAALMTQLLSQYKDFLKAQNNTLDTTGFVDKTYDEVLAKARAIGKILLKDEVVSDADYLDFQNKVEAFSAALLGMGGGSEAVN